MKSNLRALNGGGYVPPVLEVEEWPVEAGFGESLPDGDIDDQDKEEWGGGTGSEFNPWG